MPRNGNKEEVSLKRIIGEEATLLDILEEVGLAPVHPRKLPRRLEVRAGVSVSVDVDLQVPLHSLVVPRETLRKLKQLGDDTSRVLLTPIDLQECSNGLAKMSVYICKYMRVFIDVPVYSG
jgi:hypothetical protein